VFSDPNKGVCGGFGLPMDPIDSAKWSVELKITMGESISVLNNEATFFLFIN
jgi:hypothetical protein